MDFSNHEEKAPASGSLEQLGENADIWEWGHLELSQGGVGQGQPGKGCKQTSWKTEILPQLYLSGGCMAGTICKIAMSNSGKNTLWD